MAKTVPHSAVTVVRASPLVTVPFGLIGAGLLVVALALCGRNLFAEHDYANAAGFGVLIAFSVIFLYTFLFYSVEVGADSVSYGHGRFRKCVERDRVVRIVLTARASGVMVGADGKVLAKLDGILTVRGIQRVADTLGVPLS